MAVQVQVPAEAQVWFTSSGKKTSAKTSARDS